MLARAFILAAGLGTRLRPLSLHRPKPLVPICGVTPLEQALALCKARGLASVVVNAHHLAAQIQVACERAEGLRIHVQVERPEILGTGGGLRFARDRLDRRFAVLNADVLCDAPLEALLADCDLEDVLASMLLRRDVAAERYGIVAADARGRVVRLSAVARLEGAEPVHADTHFTGIHALRREALDRVPETGFACIVRSAYATLVPEGRVRARVHAGSWVDLGDPAACLDANLAALAGRLALPLDPWERVGVGLRRVDGEPHPVGDPGRCDLHPGVRLGAPCWVGPGAAVGADAELGPGTVIGAGARVGAGARLVRSVVWDGCSVPPGAQLDRAIVHDGGVLVLPG